MAGINQVIMLALSMVVISGMVGGGGLGSSVFTAISQVNVGLGFEGGISVVILAMYLDRVTGSLGSRVSPLGRRALAAANSLRGARVWTYRPHTAVAMVGVVVLAVVAGGMNVFGPSTTGTAVAAGKNVGHGRTVNLGYIPWDEGTASTYLWKEILEQRGFAPKVTQYDVGALYTGMSTGKVDFETDAWLPTTQKSYWETYKSRLDDYGSWYDRTSLELTVPSYVKGIDSLADLKGKSKEFGGRIIGIEPGAGMMKMLNDTVLKKYGLDGEYQVTTGSTASMLAQLDRSIKAKQPVVVTLWSPHWAYSKYSLKKLKDPLGAWGQGDGVHSLARRGFASDEPQVAKWLKDFKLDEKQLTSLEAAIQDAGQNHEQDGVRAWLKTQPGLVDKLAPIAA
jgi:glycine betaine/proline transport system substrate-binding protein